MHVRTKSPQETQDLGARLAHTSPRGTDPVTVVYLVGDLGAGKTTLTRGFLRALGVEGAVRSPTYTLVEVYETRGPTVVHLDLYRLSDPAELDNLGLREWARPGHVWLIEWPQRGEGWLAAADVTISCVSSESEHEFELVGHTPQGTSWMARMGTIEADNG